MLRASRLSLSSSAITIAISLFGATSASAATGVCDSNPPTSSNACIDAIQNSGGVVNDIFKDANGLTAQQLPVYGKLINAWPGCADVTSFAGAGHDIAPFECPGQYVGDVTTNTVANANIFYGSVDRYWWQPCRSSNHMLTNGCPTFTCIADGVPDAYFPWEGNVMDLGGPSNQVVIFATNDHGPQPCESAEYTVYLSDNPYARDREQNPTTSGIDPSKWNRAVLKKVFTKGWVEVRPPDPAGHAACGDTANYSVEEDSFVTVYSLPCGVTFRYASIIAGNDGLDFPECGFDSNEGEIDAVAGLTEAGEAVCPDADNDHFVDCGCTGAPPICDCNDADPNVHPGAPEPCDAVDLNCDGTPGGCPTDLFCNDSICIGKCPGGEFDCDPGSTCQTTAQGDLCVPDDCTVGGCPPGTNCVNGACLPACDGVVCPGTQVCQDGKCVDPCANIVCPAGKICQEGECVPPCSCYAADLGCVDIAGSVCDAGSNTCVEPACEGVTCTPPDQCNGATGQCDGVCTAEVMCPLGQKCVEPTGCVALCEGVSCDEGFKCDPKDGTCHDLCETVTCIAPNVCEKGKCVPSGSGGNAANGGGGSTANNATQSGGNGAGGKSSGGNDGNKVGSDDGCGCKIEGSESRDTPKLPWLIALGVVVAIRRRPRAQT